MVGEVALKYRSVVKSYTKPIAVSTFQVNFINLGDPLSWS
jgi:hypothetical protein